MVLHVLAKHPLAAVVMNIVSFRLQFFRKTRKRIQMDGVVNINNSRCLTIIAKLQEIRLNRRKLNK